VPEHHRDLVKNLADIRCAALAHAGRIKLVAFGLQTEIQYMLRRQGVAHPNIFAVFECFIFMTGGSNAMKTKLAK
jgi:hypothetical protein